MRSEAKTVAEYLAELPAERREVVSAVRDRVLKHLPEGFEERMNWGMISYEVPLERYPDTYNAQPLSYLAIAAQKNHFALYMMCVYADSEQEEALKTAYAEAGKKLDMGKSCLRFKKLDDLEMDAIATIIERTTVDDFIKQYEAARSRRARYKT